MRRDAGDRNRGDVLGDLQRALHRRSRSRGIRGDLFHLLVLHGEIDRQGSLASDTCVALGDHSLPALSHRKLACVKRATCHRARQQATQVIYVHLLWCRLLERAEATSTHEVD